MSGDLSRPKQEIIERIKSMIFPCMYCNNQAPMSASVIDLEHYATGYFATLFFICPKCHNKFAVKIEDLGKVRKP